MLQMPMIKTHNTLSHVSVCTPTSGLVFWRSMFAGRKTFYLTGSTKNRSKHGNLQRPVSVCVRSISESAPLPAMMKRKRSENCSNTEPFTANGRMRLKTGERVSACFGQKWCGVMFRRQAPRFKHTWCEPLPPRRAPPHRTPHGTGNQGECCERRTGSRGSEIMTGDELKTNHLGLKLALGPGNPSVQLSPGAPGLPLSTAEQQGRRSRARSRCMMSCLPKIRLWSSGLSVSRIKTSGVTWK